MTIEIQAVWIPVIITILTFFWAWVIVGYNDNSPLSGMDNLIATIPASIISLAAWIIYAVFK